MGWDCEEAEDCVTTTTDKKNNMKSSKQLTQERLHNLLNYDRNTGVFTWAVGRRGRARRGGIAGSHINGYISISVDGVIFKAHQLVWLYCNGELPDAVNGLFVDHINGIRDDNRVCNLRLVTHGQNQQNRIKARKDSTSGVIGVGWHPTDNAWRARITANGKCVFLGNFDSKEEACEAYLKAKARLHIALGRV